MSYRPIRVLLAEERPLIGRVLRLLIDSCDDIELAAETRCGHDALELALRIRPDVAVIDCGMPDLDCVEITRLIRERLPDVGVVVLDTYGDYVEEAERVGAATCLLKDSASRDLLDAIRLADERPTREGDQ
jgi:DNA-binding NarL/FixJ family response regulator